MGQNQWCHFGVGVPRILVYFYEGWDVHWGYGLLTHGHMTFLLNSDTFRTLGLPSGGGKKAAGAASEAPLSDCPALS